MYAELPRVATDLLRSSSHKLYHKRESQSMDDVPSAHQPSAEQEKAKIMASQIASIFVIIRSIVYIRIEQSEYTY